MMFVVRHKMKNDHTVSHPSIMSQSIVPPLVSRDFLSRGSDSDVVFLGVFWFVWMHFVLQILLYRAILKLINVSKMMAHLMTCIMTNFDGKNMVFSLFVHRIPMGMFQTSPEKTQQMSFNHRDCLCADQHDGNSQNKGLKTQ